MTILRRGFSRFGTTKIDSNLGNRSVPPRIPISIRWHGLFGKKEFNDIGIWGIGDTFLKCIESLIAKTDKKTDNAVEF